MWQRVKESIERVIPMTFGSFLMFAAVLYLMIVVGRTVWGNYKSNQQIALEQQGISSLESDLQFDEYQIAYFQTASFRDKQARAKLGYKAAGEVALSVPTDQPAPGDTVVVEDKVEAKIPNYDLWLDYFTNAS